MLVLLSPRKAESSEVFTKMRLARDIFAAVLVPHGTSHMTLKSTEVRRQSLISMITLEALKTVYTGYISWYVPNYRIHVLRFPVLIQARTRQLIGDV